MIYALFSTTMDANEEESHLAMQTQVTAWIYISLITASYVFHGYGFMYFN